MRAMIRNLIEKTRRLSGAGAVRNARLEVDHATRSAVELDQRLRNVSSHIPHRAA